MENVDREVILVELLEAAPDATLIVDEQGIIRRVNQRAVEMFGYERQELVDHPLNRLLPPEFVAGHGAHLQRYFANPKARLMGEGMELSGMRKGDVRFPVEIGLSPLNDGGVPMAVAAIRDISQRKAAEIELSEKEQRFRSLVANLPGTVYRCLHDEHWTMEFISDAVEELTGYPPEDFIGNKHRSFESIMAEEDRARVVEEVEKAVQNKAPWVMQYQIVHRSGEVRWVEEHGRAIFTPNDEIEHLDGVIADITEKKRVEDALVQALNAAESATHAKSDFLSHMSHELRTPLNGILGYAQIMQRQGEVTPSQEKNLEAIINCGDHLLALINDVLDLSKIEAGRIDLDLAPCVLPKLVHEVGDIIGQRATAKGLGFEIEISPELPKGIVSDAPKIRQVLVNLLGNAVKFTQDGGITLHVAERPEGVIRFDVTDTGVGIDPEDQEGLFDPFRQFEAGKQEGGTGLGLAITKQLCEIMGGSIQLHSELGSGSTFSVSLPLTPAEDEDLQTLETEAGPSREDLVLEEGQDFTILVADDREANRDILEQMLRHAGFKVVSADDGDTALGYIEGQQFDLVLMDMRMPRLDGLEAMQRIRAKEKTRDLCVIAVTASVYPEFRDKAIEEGFNDFLGKPFRATTLMNLLAKHLGAVFAAREAEEPVNESAAVPSADELPDGFRDRLKEALKIRNLTAINQIAAELREEESTASLAETISKMAAGFDFKGLNQLLDKTSS